MDARDAGAQELRALPRRILDADLEAARVVVADALERAAERAGIAFAAELRDALDLAARS
jgi:hypothetical protein